MELLARREKLCEELERKGLDRRVVGVIRGLARHLFVPPHMQERAYEDRALPIGFGQTISQPTIVAIMTAALQVSREHRVLEIGTGSGYQTAILAELAGTVYTLERLPELSARAQKILFELGYTNIRFRVGDGTLGWPEEAPFDRILVTAASPSVPATLLRQLKSGGLMVIPVGREREQELMLIRRQQETFYESILCQCAFVKLIGREGYREHAN